MLYTASHDQIPECIVSIDAEKAFDRVEWNYLFSVLNKYGFGPMFTGWIKLLYAAPTAMVQTDGITSQPFRLGRGTRQVGLQRIKKLTVRIVSQIRVTDRIIFWISKKKKRRQININLVFLFINTFKLLN